MSAVGRDTDPVSAVGRGGVSGGARFGFPKAARLRKSPEFAPVQQRGRRIKGSLLVGVFLQRGAGPARFGLAVSRKVGGAVVRNRVKRHLREAIRHVRPGLDGVDLVLIARSEAAHAGSAQFRLEVERICTAAASRAPLR